MKKEESHWLKEFKKRQVRGCTDEEAFVFTLRDYLAEVEKIIVFAYAKCVKCLRDAENNNRESHIEGFENRIDELILLYSDVKGIDFNEAKQKLKGEEK